MRQRNNGGYPLHVQSDQPLLVTPGEVVDLPVPVAGLDPIPTAPNPDPHLNPDATRPAPEPKPAARSGGRAATDTHTTTPVMSTAPATNPGRKGAPR